MPCETTRYFPVSDAKYEPQFLKRSKFLPTPSLRGHAACGGDNAEDAAFIDAQIARFLAH